MTADVTGAVAPIYPRPYVYTAVQNGPRRAQARPGASAESLGGHLNSGSKRALLIEGIAGDAPSIADLLTGAEASNFAVTRVRTLREAFGPLTGGRFDIVLLDLQVGDSGGLDGVRQIQEKAPEAAVLVVTAEESLDATAAALRAGAQECLVRSRLDRDYLGRVVRHAIERQRVRTALHRETGDRSRQSRKIEAVGMLAGGIAHDFNNLLSSILGYCDMLLSRFDPEDPRREDVEEIRKAGERAASLTRYLLSFSRRQPLAPKVLDLNDVVSNLERMLRRLIGDHIKLRTNLDPSLGPVRTDPSQIELALMNLAINARDAMPRGGTLTFETANCQLDETYARGRPGVHPGAYVMLVVSDTGTGIDASTREHLFEPFFTTKEYGKGTGLGLSTVYGIVKQSGGNIWVYSEPGRGSTFKIYLPRILAEVMAIRREETVTPPMQGTETILLVDDEPAILCLAREILEMKGYSVLTAGNGSEATRYGEHHPGPIHLLLTDVVMPEISGPYLAARLAPLRPDMKVLYMSGYTGDMIFQQGVLDVDKNFLQKPFGVDALARKVRQVLDQDETHAVTSSTGTN